MSVQGNKSTAGKMGVWLPFLFSIVLIAGMLVGMQLSKAVPVVVLDQSGTANYPANQGKLEELLRYIESKYVDSTDRDQLVEDAINTILGQLDPHSSYIPANDLEYANDQLEGNFEGIGVEYLMMEDTMVVVSPLPGGPSEAAGILSGDKIVEVDDSLIAGVGLRQRDLVSLLRGEKGTQVVVGVKREKLNGLKRFTITRDEITMNSIDAAYMLDEETGYIKLNFFSANTYEEFMQSLERMVEKEGMEDLIIDLRRNPGGYLQQATQMLSQLFPKKGELLVYTQGHSAHRTEYKTHGRALYDLGKIAVLIDENSASASEIMAGALQDHDRAVIVGRRSFGKGLVQEPYLMRDGSALRLTVARFYTPSGRSIQKPYDDIDGYRSDFWQRIESGELTSEDKQVVLDSTPYYTDSRRIVYGGGGIQPDIFVPLDPVYYESAYLSVRPLIQEFVYRQKEKDGLSEDKISESDLYKGLPGFSRLYVSFKAFANERGLDISDAEWEMIKKPVSHLLVAQIGQLLYDREVYFKVLSQYDKVLLKAQEALQKEMALSNE